MKRRVGIICVTEHIEEDAHVNKRAVLIALMASAMMAIGSAAYATPSTLIWIPSTDIQSGSMHLGIDIYEASGDGDLPTDYGLTFGNGEFEYGVDYFEGIDDPVFFNAKALLIDESPTSPRLVAGVYGLGTRSATSSSIIYLLGSKTFPIGRFTAGYGVGRKAALGEDNAMILLGFDKALSDRWWAAVDYQGGKSAFGALNAGVAYTFSPTTSVIVGRDWYNDRSIPDTLTAQLDMNF